GSAQAHQRACPSCAAFARRLHVFDEDVANELCVPVPEGLADRVLLHAQRHTDSHARDRAMPLGRLRAALGGLGRAAIGSLQRFPARVVPVALAATLLLGVGFASIYALTLQEERVALAVIAHVAQEETDEVATKTAADAPAAVPSAVLAASGVRLPGNFHEVRYLGRCGPPSHTGEHIVMQSPFGRASLVLMSGEAAHFRIVRFDNGRFAVMAPARVGSLAVVAASEQAAVQIAGLML
ncbi:MAG: DUF3379 family protein, partial [Betaproteobacteria bacterium]